MKKKLTLLIVLLSLASFSYSQTKVLVIGFPEKNFISDWKPKEKLAKKNLVSVESVDDLYRDSLLDAIENTKEGIEFIIAKKNEEELFSESRYSMLKNDRKKEYFGTQSFQKEELIELFNKYKVDYIVHISLYRMYMSMGFNMHTKIVHRFDYQIINRQFETVAADKFKFSGFFQGSFRPEGVQKKYENKASILSERLSEIIVD